MFQRRWFLFALVAAAPAFAESRYDRSPENIQSPAAARRSFHEQINPLPDTLPSDFDLMDTPVPDLANEPSFRIFDDEPILKPAPQLMPPSRTPKLAPAPRRSRPWRRLKALTLALRDSDAVDRFFDGVTRFYDRLAGGKSRLPDEEG